MTTGQVLEGTEHRQVQHAVSVLRGVVIHEADRLEPELWMAQQFFPDQFTGGPGTHDDHPVAVDPAALLSAARRRDTQPGQRREDRGQQPVHEQDRQRHSHGGDTQNREDQAAQDQACQPGNGRRRDQPLNLDDPGVAPQPAIDADPPRDVQLDGEGDEEIDDRRLLLFRAPLESFEPKGVREDRG